MPADTNPALRIAVYALPAIVSFSMFSLLYKYVPTVRPPWREATGSGAEETGEAGHIEDPAHGIAGRGHHERGGGALGALDLGCDHA